MFSLSPSPPQISGHPDLFFLLFWGSSSPGYGGIGSLLSFRAWGLGLASRLLQHRDVEAEGCHGDKHVVLASRCLRQGTSPPLP